MTETEVIVFIILWCSAVILIGLLRVLAKIRELNQHINSRAREMRRRIRIEFPELDEDPDLPGYETEDEE